MPVINGTEGPDTLNDTAGDDVINGLGDNDTITVSLGGADDADGGGGNDRLIIDARVLGGSVFMEAPTQTANGLNGRVVWASAELDFLNIESFTIHTADANQRDIVTTGGGDDIFYHMPQASPDYLSDTINLGDGIDTLIADFSAVTGRGVRISFATGNANEVDGSVGLITSPDNSGAVEKVGFSGVDRFVVIGTAMSDVLWGRAGDDVFDGGGAQDFIDGGGGNDMLTGGAGDDRITGGEGEDVLIGGEGADHLDGGTGADVMTGGIGNDQYTYDNVGDEIIELAGEGTDTIVISNLISVYVHALGTNIENIRGTSSSFDPGNVQTLIGNAENNSILGGSGSDIINTGLGTDSAKGGGTSGFGITDRLIVDYSSLTGDITTLNAHPFPSAEPEQVFTDGGANSIAFEDFSHLDIRTGTGNDSITTKDSIDTIRTGAGNDFISALGGNDYLDGGAGVDQMLGGAGDDTFIVDEDGDLVIEQIGEGNDTVFARTTYHLVAGSSVETLSTALHGDTAAISLFGNSFAQTLIGNNGANQLDGAGGADVLIGLGGDDLYNVDTIADQVVEAAGGGNDIVYAETSYALGSNQSIETLSTRNHAGTENFFLTGNQLNNTLIGNAGNNLLNGNNGADVMYGLAGDDTYVIDDAGDLVIDLVDSGTDIVFTYLSHTLSNGNQIETLSTVSHSATDAINLGGSDYDNTLIGNNGANHINGGGGADVMIGLGGNDTYVAENALDQVQEAAGGGSDTLFSFVSYTLAAGQEVESLSSASQGGTAALDFTGNEFGQAVIGNAGANVIDGKGGGDTLYGLGGADFFAFTTALGAGNIDTLADFSVADDTIRLDDAIFTAIGGLGTLNANAFVTGSAAADADDRIVYNSATGALLYDADGTGGTAAVQFATLATGLSLTASDFVVI